MSKCKSCHCDCHCDGDLHTHHYDNDICVCDDCSCTSKRTYKTHKEWADDMSYENNG